MAVHDEDNLGFKKYLRGNNTKLQVLSVLLSSLNYLVDIHSLDILQWLSVEI